MGPDPVCWCPYKRRFGHTERRQGRVHTEGRPRGGRRRQHLPAEGGRPQEKPHLPTPGSQFWREYTSIVQATLTVGLSHGSPSRRMHPAVIIHPELMKVNQSDENCELVTPSETESWRHPGWSPKRAPADTQPQSAHGPASPFYYWTVTAKFPCPALPPVEEGVGSTGGLPSDPSPMPGAQYPGPSETKRGSVAEGTERFRGRLPGAPESQTHTLQTAHCHVQLPWPVQAGPQHRGRGGRGRDGGRRRQRYRCLSVCLPACQGAGSVLGSCKQDCWDPVPAPGQPGMI